LAVIIKSLHRIY